MGHSLLPEAWQACERRSAHERFGHLRVSWCGGQGVGGPADADVVLGENAIYLNHNIGGVYEEVSASQYTAGISRIKRTSRHISS